MIHRIFGWLMIAFSNVTIFFGIIKYSNIYHEDNILAIVNIIGVFLLVAVAEIIF